MSTPQSPTEIPEQNEEVYLELTSEVISSYVANNPVSTNELPSLIAEVYAAFKKVDSRTASEPAVKSKPAVPVKKSMTDDYIICLEDGKKFKSLKRHLRSHYDMSPEEYREKWGLPYDYPMVAPEYAKKSSALAKDIGLGKR